jgi:osmoprotectant transport system substrate-binding protein
MISKDENRGSTMKKMTAVAALFLGILLSASLPGVMEACVGKTLYLGRMPGTEQEILAELFVWLVSERTGTSIEVKPFPDSRSSHSALEKAQIDLYLEEPLVALREILGEEGAGGSGDLRQQVKSEYAERFNLVWLEPWGMEGKSREGDSLSLVAPVVRRDTLKKFPALSRLVNKMAGVVDDGAMEQMVAESGQKPVREVTKAFLKQKKLI